MNLSALTGVFIRYNKISPWQLSQLQMANEDLLQTFLIILTENNDDLIKNWLN